MNEEQPVIVCAPSTGTTKGKNVVCKCGEIVWLSDSSLEALKPDDPEPRIVCLPCFLKEFKDTTHKIQPLTETQITEVKEGIKKK